jgi:hypothetical protein
MSQEISDGYIAIESNPHPHSGQGPLDAAIIYRHRNPFLRLVVSAKDVGGPFMAIFYTIPLRHA